MNAPDLPLVSIVIPLRNEERYVGRCLQSLAQQDYSSERLEVLVVDGHSSDSSRMVVEDCARRSPFPVRLLNNHRRITSSALNIGIAAARGDVIGIASAHSWLAPDFVSQGVRLLCEREVDCVCGPIASVGEALVGRAIALAMSHPFGVGDARFRYSQREQLVDAAAFALYRRGVFARVGGFDQGMKGDSDADFHYRLTEMGGRILQSPRLQSFYFVRPTLRSLFRQYFDYGFTKLVVMRRYPHRIKARQLVPSLFVAALVGSGGAALVNGSGRRLLALVAGSYASASLVASTVVASRGGWRYMPFLPLAFACLHFGYGLGLLAALGRWAVRWRGIPVMR
ncbi:MAG: glycosyltransferase family 2 protein [Dehalococcoidia bacterium]